MKDRFTWAYPGYHLYPLEEAWAKFCSDVARPDLTGVLDRVM